MQEYLQESRFREVMDGLGVRFGVLALCLGWFMLLWGVTAPSLFSGIALWLLIFLLRRKSRDGRLKRREEKLRRRIGGEMAIERLLLTPPRRAHFETAMVLSQRYPLTLLRAGDKGVLCQLREEKALVSFCQLPTCATVSAGDVLSLQREARELGAARAILCAPCGISAQAQTQSGGEIPVAFLSRDALISLFGRANPVTDAQLVALGKRRRQQRPSQWLPVILNEQRMGRYAFYGALLLIMHLLTGLIYYAVPGILCLCLAAGCRCVKQKEAVL
ncbi:MAG: hypothetical protein IJ189_04840 [Clostridia bacterium]|nr:hypothetical protein [Clostridia bacterium]